MRTFSRFHPFVMLIFFVGVIGVSMFSMNPVVSLMSFIGGLLFRIMLGEHEKLKRELIFYAVLGALVTLTNPIFSHNGETVLFFVNDTPITAESFAYGGAAALMLISALVWFGCFSRVMTSDRIIYLFSGIAPSLGLVLSSALKFVPSMLKKYREIHLVQKTLMNEGESKKSGFYTSVRSFSALVTWAIEHSADASSSMSCRGYSIKGRTSFSLFKFTGKDFLLLIYCLFSFAFMFIVIGRKGAAFLFYPRLVFPSESTGYMIFSGMWIITVMLPVLFELKGELKWKLSN